MYNLIGPLCNNLSILLCSSYNYKKYTFLKIMVFFLRIVFRSAFDRQIKIFSNEKSWNSFFASNCFCAISIVERLCCVLIEKRKKPDKFSVVLNLWSVNYLARVSSWSLRPWDGLFRMISKALWLFANCLW